MAYSEVEFTYIGGPQVFPTNFTLGVLETDHIVVNVDGQVDGLGEPIDFAFTYNAGTGEVTVTDTLTVGWHGTIRRVTPVDNLLVDFEANADVTKRNLSRSTKQVIMVVQELADSREADSTAIQETLEIVTELQEDIADDVATVQAALADAEAAAAAAASAAAVALEKENSMLRDRGTYQSGITYNPSDIFTFEGRSYITQVAHISVNVAADLAIDNIRIFADKGAPGAGTGDMLGANNLSDLANKPAALAVIGGQPIDEDLTAIAGLTGTGLVVRTGAGAAATRQLTSSDGSVTITNEDGIEGDIDLTVANNLAGLFDTPGATVGPFDFPEGTEEFELTSVNSKLSGSGNMIVQLRVGETWVTAGYVFYGLRGSGNVPFTTGMGIVLGSSSTFFTGRIKFQLHDPDTDTWLATIEAGPSNTGATDVIFGSGYVNLSGPPNGVRVITSSGTFVTPSFNVRY